MNANDRPRETLVIDNRRSLCQRSVAVGRRDSNDLGPHVAQQRSGDHARRQLSQNDGSNTVEGPGH